jgi:hypothetical protein
VLELLTFANSAARLSIHSSLLRQRANRGDSEFESDNEISHLVMRVELIEAII